jgi:hypothetical protein
LRADIARIKPSAHHVAEIGTINGASRVDWICARHRSGQCPRAGFPPASRKGWRMPYRSRFALARHAGAPAACGHEANSSWPNASQGPLAAAPRYRGSSALSLAAAMSADQARPRKHAEQRAAQGIAWRLPLRRSCLLTGRSAAAFCRISEAVAHEHRLVVLHVPVQLANLLGEKT